MKKILALALVLVMSLSFAQTALAADMLYGKISAATETEVATLYVETERMGRAYDIEVSGSTVTIDGEEIPLDGGMITGNVLSEYAKCYALGFAQFVTEVWGATNEDIVLDYEYAKSMWDMGGYVYLSDDRNVSIAFMEEPIWYLNGQIIDIGGTQYHIVVEDLNGNIRGEGSYEMVTAANAFELKSWYRPLDIRDLRSYLTESDGPTIEAPASIYDAQYLIGAEEGLWRKLSVRGAMPEDLVMRVTAGGNIPGMTLNIVKAPWYTVDYIAWMED